MVRMDEEATHGDEEATDRDGGASVASGAPAATPTFTEVAAESLADALRRTGALPSLAAHAASGGYDARLAFSCLANLARVGLQEALCQSLAVRTVLVDGLVLRVSKRFTETFKT